MSQKDTDLQEIKKLITIMKENDLSEIEIKHGDNKIMLKRGMAQPMVTTVPMIDASNIGGGAKAADNSKDDGLIDITSPLVGTFYAKASPDSAQFIEVGSSVNDQTVICIIEAMKVMNEIKAETTGKIAEILVSDGEAVEYGQVLFKVQPN